MDLQQMGSKKNNFPSVFKMMPLQFKIKLNSELCSEKQITHQINGQIQKFKQVFKLFDEAKTLDTLSYVNKTDRVFISTKGKNLEYKQEE